MKKIHVLFSLLILALSVNFASAQTMERTKIINNSVVKIQNLRAQKLVYDETVWPVDEFNLVSMFGPRSQSGSYDFHRGIDISGTLGDPVYSIADGVIYRAYEADDPNNPYKNSGNTIVVMHEADLEFPFHDGTYTKYFSLYAHLDSLSVELESGDGTYQNISKGDLVGTLGQSGTATFPHLHFETRIATLCTQQTQEDNPNMSCASTFSQPRDPHVNPLLFLEYPDNNSTLLKIKSENPLQLLVSFEDEEMDFNQLIVTRNGEQKVINFNLRTGIDPENIDNPSYNGVTITTFPFTTKNPRHRLQFDIPSFDGYDTIEVTDIWGHGFKWTRQ
ncbi:M23 family metallopeptidase [Candidatus Peregrinibacteria bacterium]|nr:MAG: M23 family metallopeptidase [Candidatus Peregrinibacteria bacterium]